MEAFFPVRSAIFWLFNNMFPLFYHIIRLVNRINRLVNGRINGLVGRLAARRPQDALPRPLPIGKWPH